MNQDKVLEKTQLKIRDILRPLSLLWDIVKEAINSNEQSVNGLLDEIYLLKIYWTNRFNGGSKTYHRRYNKLNNLMGFSNQNKETLMEKKDFLQKCDGNLLRKKFRNHIVEVTETRKTTIEAFSVGKSKSRKSWREPFPEGSQRKHQQRGRVVGHQIFLNQRPNYQNNKQRWQQQNSNSNRRGRYQH